MDEQIRRAERAAATGDPEAVALWIRLCARMGLHFRDFPRTSEELTDAEEVQADYDDIFWHRTTALRMGWDWEPRAGLYKAHHTWGHRGWGEKNGKQKTLRTHRDGSRKNYRLRNPKTSETEDETARARRRKKRFGGKEHRRQEWSYNPETERFRSWCVITKPNLDE